MTWTRVDWGSYGDGSLNGKVEEIKGREGLEKRTHTTLFKDLSCKKEQKLEQMGSRESCFSLMKETSGYLMMQKRRK